MHIDKIEIQNFRGHNNTIVQLSDSVNILVGQNNTGKTAFLDAINYAIGFRRGTPSEDDFYASEESFDPKACAPIKVIIELRETQNDRFSDKVSYIFDNAIQFDEEVCPEEPIRYIRICYECGYDRGKDGYEEVRYFVDHNNKRIARDSLVRKDHLSFFPFFYLSTLRDIGREIGNKSSFWGRLRTSIDCKDKQIEIQQMIEELNKLVLKDDTTVNSLVTKLRQLETSLNVSEDSIALHAFPKRSWELLDELNIYLKTTNSNLSLPITKHGMGTQSIAIIIIFSAYVDILLPKIVDNEEATPILGIEEPEAHVHPQAQRAVFKQIMNIRGQKIISTHSPYIVDRANIHDYIIFKCVDGTSRTDKVPLYNSRFVFKYGLPEPAYENNRYLTPDERLLVERYVKHGNAELLFSSLFILCEGDTERVFLERVFDYHSGGTAAEFGISIIGCEGKCYTPFLKIASQDAFDLKWLILSDAEVNTKEELKNAVLNCGYDYANVENRIYYLSDGKDFEDYCIECYGNEVNNIVRNHFQERYNRFCNQPSNQGKSETTLTREFLDTIKVRFAEQLALHIVANGLDLPEKIRNLIDKAVEEVRK